MNQFDRTVVFESVVQKLSTIHIWRERSSKFLQGHTGNYYTCANTKISIVDWPIPFHLAISQDSQLAPHTKH